MNRFELLMSTPPKCQDAETVAKLKAEIPMLRKAADWFVEEIYQAWDEEFKGRPTTSFEDWLKEEIEE